jgi:hypothetical protein
VVLACTTGASLVKARADPSLKVHAGRLREPRKHRGSEGRLKQPPQ